MNIDNFEVYSKKVNQILDKLDPFSAIVLSMKVREQEKKGSKIQRSRYC